jgi:hypothetical protein
MNETNTLSINVEAPNGQTKGNAGTNPLKSFKEYYLGVFIQPRPTFDALVQDKRRVRFGLSAVTITAFLYTLFYFMAAASGGAPSTFKPWLAIPIEQYFYYNRFLVAPSMFMSWILAAGITQLLSRLFGGKGSFEDTTAVFGFGISVACWSTLIHDLTDGFLGFIGAIDMRAYEEALNSPTIWRTILWILFAIYFVWFPVLFSKGVGAAHGLRRRPAVFLGILAFVIYQFVFLIFNR